MLVNIRIMPTHPDAADITWSSSNIAALNTRKRIPAGRNFLFEVKSNLTALIKGLIILV
jgi:hypothetical protein